MRTLWLVRHGNRADFVDRTWRDTAPRPHDPPLSDDGVMQARETGARLAREHIDYLFTSPFLRTVETAWHLAECLDLPVHIEHGLCEMLRAEWFPCPPDYLPVDEMARRFPRVNTTYHSVHRPAYPEDDAALRARTAATVAQLLRQHPGNLLLIGHGATLYGIGHALLAPAVPLHTPLCCVIQLYEHDGRWHVAADGRDVSHLSQRESEIRLA